MRKVVDSICVKLIAARLTNLSECDDTEFVDEFVEAAHDYLEKTIPWWRKSTYFDPKNTGKLSPVTARVLRQGKSPVRHYASRRSLRALPRTASLRRVLSDSREFIPLCYASVATPSRPIASVPSAGFSTCNTELARQQAIFGLRPCG